MTIQFHAQDPAKVQQEIQSFAGAGEVRKNILFKMDQNLTHFFFRILPDVVGTGDPKVHVRLHYNLVGPDDQFRLVSCPGRDTCAACAFHAANRDDPNYKATRNFARASSRYWFNVVVLQPDPAAPGQPGQFVAQPRVWVWDSPEMIYKNDLAKMMTFGGDATDLSTGVNFVCSKEPPPVFYKVDYAVRDPQAPGGMLRQPIPPIIADLFTKCGVIPDIQSEHAQKGWGVYNLQNVKDALAPVDAAFIQNAIQRSAEREYARASRAGGQAQASVPPAAGGAVPPLPTWGAPATQAAPPAAAPAPGAPGAPVAPPAPPASPPAPWDGAGPATAPTAPVATPGAPVAAPGATVAPPAPAAPTAPPEAPTAPAAGNQQAAPPTPAPTGVPGGFDSFLAQNQPGNQ